MHDGSWAELIVVPEDDFVAVKPRSVDLAHAGAAPLAAITALAAYDALEQAGDALQAFSITHRQGKLGLTIAS